MRVTSSRDHSLILLLMALCIVQLMGCGGKSPGRVKVARTIELLESIEAADNREETPISNYVAQQHSLALAALRRARHDSEYIMPALVSAYIEDRLEPGHLTLSVSWLQQSNTVVKAVVHSPTKSTFEIPLRIQKFDSQFLAGKGDSLLVVGTCDLLIQDAQGKQSDVQLNSEGVPVVLSLADGTTVSLISHDGNQTGPSRLFVDESLIGIQVAPTSSVAEPRKGSD